MGLFSLSLFLDKSYKTEMNQFAKVQFVFTKALLIKKWRNVKGCMFQVLRLLQEVEYRKLFQLSCSLSASARDNLSGLIRQDTTSPPCLLLLTLIQSTEGELPPSHEHTPHHHYFSSHCFVCETQQLSGNSSVSALQHVLSQHARSSGSQLASALECITTRSKGVSNSVYLKLTLQKWVDPKQLRIPQRHHILELRRSCGNQFVQCTLVQQISCDRSRQGEGLA